MSKVHNLSPECVKSELDIFGLPPTQVSLDRGEWTEFYPMSNITENSPIQFNISGNSDYYLDLAQSFLQFVVRVAKINGEPLKPEEDTMIPVNLFMQAVLREIEIELGGKNITPSTYNYAYRGYIETLLNYGSESKLSKLTASMFCQDTAGKFDDPARNLGGKKRRAMFNNANNNTIDLIGPLHCDLFMQNKLLLNLVDLKIKLFTSKHSFCFVADVDNYKFIIEEAVLVIRREKPSLSVQLSHAKTLQQGTAKYPIRRTFCQALSVPKGNLNFNQDDIFNGKVPRKIIVGLVDNEAYNGSYKKNPFNFQTFGANFVGVYVDGQPYPQKPLTPNYKQGRYIRSYFSTYQALGKAYADVGNSISREDYPLGNALYAFDLTPDSCTGDHFNLTTQSNLRLELHFDEALEQTISIIMLVEFDNVIEIDKNRNVIFDF